MAGRCERAFGDMCMYAMNMHKLNCFRFIYLYANNLITEIEYMFTSIFSSNRPSRRNLVCWVRNPSYANNKDTSGAGESMQVLLDRGSYQVPLVLGVD